MLTYAKKLITFALLTITLAPALHCFDAQREYPYLSLLIINANSSAFNKKLNQLIVSPAAKTAEFREMLKTLNQDVEHALLNTQAMHGAGVSGNIVDNAWSQCKWGIGELGLAAIMYKFYPKFNPETHARQYYGMIATGVISGMLGVTSFKNGIVDYFFARRYGQHIQKTINSLEEIKKQIALHSKM